MSDTQPEQWRLNVAAVILDTEDNVLLGTTAGNSPYWHFPQGGVGKGETMQEAVLREVWEEVGIPPEECTILASYGGLRYTYRHKNKKSERWLGQEQTYFLIRCKGTQSITIPVTQSDEFASLCWVPWHQLTLDMFVPFKRSAIAPALEAFFPRGCMTLNEVEKRLSPVCYAYKPTLSLNQYPCADKALFGGGKAEMVAQIEDLTSRINVAQRRVQHGRLLVQMLGMPGSGLTNCLRRLARCMDPLYTHAIQPLGPDIAMMPNPGECVLLNVSYLAQSIAAADTATAISLAQSAKLWQQAQAEQGITIINIFLHVSHSEHVERADVPVSADQWQKLIQQADRVLQNAADSEIPLYIIPSDCRWYRDFVVASIVASALEDME